jgi:heme O synthase-like polyprenyltransferase
MQQRRRQASLRLCARGFSGESDDALRSISRQRGIANEVNGVDVSRVSRMGIYAELSKARLSALVVATTFSGFMVAGPPFDWLLMGSTCIGTGLCAASANTFNQVCPRSM